MFSMGSLRATLFRYMVYRQFVPQKCLHPVRIFDAAHNCYSYVRCGHCTACQLSYQSMWRNKIETHCKTNGLYPVFITLTYDNENLPLVHYDEISRRIVGFEYTDVRRIPRSDRVKVTRRCLTHPNFINFDLAHYDYLPHYVKSRHGDKYVYDESNSFAICWLPDVQKFVKRLRAYMSRVSSLDGFDTSLTYFICSEYGPKTFRPHYHGLLFFRSFEAASYAVEHGVFEAWRKQSNRYNAFTGSQIASHVLQSGSAASYVSKYVTSFTKLPPVLKSETFKPFHTQSLSIPLGSEAFNLADVPDMLDKDDFLRNISYIDSNTKERVDIQLSYPLAAWRRVFPKFLCDSHFTVAQKRRAFQMLYRLFCDDGPLPDYRQCVIDNFHLGEVLYSGSKECKENLDAVPSWRYDGEVSFETFMSHYDTSSHYINMVDRDTFSMFTKVSNRNRHIVSRPVAFDTVTPSKIITSSEWIDNHLMEYLFGFDQNRAACRKIVNCMRSVPWCRDPNTYLEYYLKYELKLFTYSLSQRYQYLNSLPRVEPADLFYLYPSFFRELPQDLTVLTEDKYNLLQSFCELYGFDFTDFYDDYGKIYAFSYWSTSAGISYLRDLHNLKTKQKIMTQYNHDASFDL